MQIYHPATTWSLGFICIGRRPCLNHIRRDTVTNRFSIDSVLQMASEVYVVLISGCSSGIGLDTALHLAKDPEKRFKVYATMRNLAKKKGKLEEHGKEYLGKTLVIEQMNVSSDESVKNIVEKIIAIEERIDVLCEY